MTRNRVLGLTVLAVCLVLAFFIEINDHSPRSFVTRPAKVKSTSSPNGSAESKNGRAEYFFMMLRDPAKNDIPAAIRQRELEFAGVLKKSALNHLETARSITWKEAGPNDVGGRTRALAVDVTDPNTILAGGVSGGMWKSTDNGATWKIKNTPEQPLSVTSIAQDRRPGFTNNWYYVCGEYPFTSACAPFAIFSGNGIYKSTDNGESWFVLSSTDDKNFTDWDFFDFCMKIIVTQKGSILIATAGYGIFRSTDGGSTFESSLGGPRENEYSDVAETKDSVLVAVISSGFPGGASKNDQGVYKSTDEGLSWVNITPSTFPQSHRRSVLAAAPSNPDVVYILTDVGETVNDRDDVRFHKINLRTGVSEDRSANMPGFNKDANGIINTQGCYNLTLAVKPDDENLVIIGATSLFRSMNGFAKKPANRRIHWIGGYHQASSGGWMFYPGLHPDIHAFAFDPSDPGKLWVGHDGGLSYTSDITNILYPEFFPWENKNNGYNVTQFYMVTMPETANDMRILGGTQDNGSPFFTFDGSVTSKSKDASSGDGSWAYFGKNFLYASAQEGWLIRYRYNAEGKPDDSYWSLIYPKNAQNQLFINPFAVDPGDEEVIYYPAGNAVWRNRHISSIPDYENGTMLGWEKMANVNLPEGYIITAMRISKNNPSGTLYYAAFSYNEKPKIYKLPNAQASNTEAVEISIPQAAEGSYIHNISVNPDNGNEILIVMSNYNIIGLYYSKDGGETYTAVEGNLSGTSNLPGPSLRGASILPTDNGTVYLLGTSIGVFSTKKLDGDKTFWTQEGPEEIGNTIVNYITSRKSDGRIVAGTHGRGIFSGEFTAAGGGSKGLSVDNITAPGKFELFQNYPNPFNPETVIRFTLPKAGNVTMKLYDINGREVSTLLNDYKEAGNYEIRYNAHGLSSGIYYYSIHSGNYSAAKKMVFVK